ncbi:MAG: carboxypeptidase regulatory-like domain-containing protein, partial [Candidatus Coatesbacteria bacterium]
MKEGLGLLVLSVLVITAAAAYADDWEPPIGPTYRRHPPANEFECADDVREYYEEGSYLWAKEAAEYYVANYPLGRDIPEVTYILANCKVIGGDFEGVLEMLESVMEYYPNSPFSTESADLYLSLIVFGPKKSAYSYRWGDFLYPRLGINASDPVAVNQNKLFKARFEALNLAERAYLKRMFYLSGPEREAAADANVANFITLMPYLGFEFAGDDKIEFKKKEAYLSAVEEKEMSREMKATVAFYRGILYADNYPVEKDDWPGYEAGGFYTWCTRERLAQAEDVWRRIAEEYPDTRAALLAKTVLAHYEVVLHGNPKKGAENFAELVGVVENDDYAEYLEGVIEKLQAPSLAITHVRNDPRADPQITIDMAAKEYDAVNLAFYPVEPIHYRELGRELDAVDIYLNDGTVLKPDIGVTIPESRIGLLNAELIDRVEARPTVDLPGVGAPVKEWTVSTNYRDDLQITPFSTEISELKPGLYLIEATTSDGNTSRSTFLHSMVTAVTAVDGDYAYVQLCDTANGEPAPVTDIKAYVAFKELVGKGHYDEAYEYVDLELEPEGDGYVVDVSDIWNWNGGGHIVLDSDRGPAFINIDPRVSYYYYRYDEFGVVYTDRPLYCPGQTVNYKFVLRSVDYERQMLAPIQGESIALKSISSSGDEIWTGEGVTDEFGTLWGNLELPPDAKLGEYTIQAGWGRNELYGGREHAFDWPFEVEEYEKPEYQLFLEPEKDRYLSGEKIRLKAKGMYYFGAPMSDSKVEYVVTRTGYTDDEYDYLVVVKEGEGQTDADGEYVIEWRSKYSGKYESRYDVYVTLTDPSNHEVDGDGSVPTFRSDRFVEITTDKHEYYSSDTIVVKLTAHDWYEEPVSMPVTLRAFNVEKQYDKKGHYKELKRVKKLYETEVITGGDGNAEIPIELKNPGEMVVLEAEVKDTVGTKVTDTVDIAIIEETEETPDRVPELEITVDEQHPALGDVVFAKVRSRFEGITVGLLSSSTVFEDYENVTLEPDSDGGYSYTFPIYTDRRFLPELVLEAITFYEGKDYRDTVYVYIRNTDIELQVDVETAKGEYHPSDGKAVVSLTTTDDNGLPVVANVSVAVVDEALLALQQDNTGSIPEGYHRLLGRVRTGVYSKNSLKTMGDIETATYKFLNYEGLDYSPTRMFGTSAEGKALDILKTLHLPAVPAEDIRLRFPTGYVDKFRPELYDNTYVGLREPPDLTGYLSGIVSGLVTDENGKGVSGALVVVKGANMFATTNADGYYVVNGVPAGYFDVKASRVGYSEMVQTGVKVVAGLRTNVSFQLQSQVTGTHVIGASPPLIEFKETMTTDTIDTYIVDEFAYMLARTPGIVYEDSDAATLNLHIRGGRGDEIAYIVDGISILNPVIAEVILRDYFADAAFWEPAVITDADGKAYIEIELPDNLTTWKVMALGVDKGQRIGWGCGDFKVTKN